MGTVLLGVLSLDTFFVAMALARHGPALRLVLLLSAAEAIAPLVGFAAAAVVFGFAPDAMGALSGVLLVLLGLYLLYEAREGEDEAEKLLSGGVLLGVAAVSLDELGVGAALPGLGVSPLFAAAWMVVQAPLFALAGLWLGRRVLAWPPLRFLPGALLVVLGALKLLTVG